jgi:hypothetical protein
MVSTAESNDHITTALTHLHACTDVLENLVDHRNAEFGMVATEVIQQHSKQMDIRVLDLPNFGEHAVQLAHDLAYYESASECTGTAGRANGDSQPGLPSAIFEPISRLDHCCCALGRCKTGGVYRVALVCAPSVELRRGQADRTA